MSNVMPIVLCGCQNRNCKLLLLSASSIYKFSHDYRTVSVSHIKACVRGSQALDGQANLLLGVY
jgi:hypothetical protein